MKKIKNLKKITAIYNEWKPTDIAFIKSLEWVTPDLLIVFYCQLRENINGWPDISKPFFEISMTFKNISMLKLDFNGAILHQIGGFDILDISDNGLEKINFQVEDYENNSINFFCEEIEINEIFNLKKFIIF